MDIRRGHRNQLGVTLGNQTDPESGPKLDLFFCSHENGMVRYRIVPISGSRFLTAQFLDLFWNGPLDFFHTRVTQPLAIPLFGPERNGTISYHSELKHFLMFVLFIINFKLVADSANHKILRPSAKIVLFLETPGSHENCSILMKLKSLSNYTAQLAKSILFLSFC